MRELKRKLGQKKTAGFGVVHHVLSLGSLDLSQKKNVQALLKSENIKPSKKWGQNFLISCQILEKIILASQLTSSDLVLEIGPGIGTLTQKLAQKAKKVIALEKDPRMIAILKQTLRGFNNVQILEADALKIPLSELSLDRTYKLIANLPYYIASPVIKRFLEAAQPPRLMVLMVQKEVGQRICSKIPKMNLLALSVQFWAQAQIVGFVPQEAFWPKPQVKGALIKIIPLRKKPRVNPGLFFKIIKTGFAQPRKQLINNLKNLVLVSETESFRYNKGGGGEIGYPPVLEKQRAEGERQKPKVSGKHSSRAKASDYVLEGPNKVRLEKKDILSLLEKARVRPEKRPQHLELKDWISLCRAFDQANRTNQTEETDRLIGLISDLC